MSWSFGELPVSCDFLLNAGAGGRLCAQIWGLWSCCREVPGGLPRKEAGEQGQLRGGTQLGAEPLGGVSRATRIPRGIKVLGVAPQSQRGLERADFPGTSLQNTPLS